MEIRDKSRQGGVRRQLRFQQLKPNEIVTVYNIYSSQIEVQNHFTHVSIVDTKTSQRNCD